MRRKFLLIVTTLLLLMGLISLSNVSVAFAQGSVSSPQSAAGNPSVNYATHVQDIGWQNPVSDGEMSGTEGQAKRLESIKISVNNVQDLGVKYSTHVQDYGWLDYISDGKESGTTGQAKRLEAIKIELTGGQAANYDIYYRVHAESYGWMGWVKNGELAGTTGQSKRLEAIEIMIVAKGATPPVNNSSKAIEKPTILDPSVTYRTHVQDYGWLDPVSNGKLSGKDDQGKRLEAIQISLENAPYSGGISYKTHVQEYGWLNSVSDGSTSGTTGEGKRAEAIQVNLTGELANHYDVYYRVHSQDFGWLGWAKNGESAGTEGLSKQLEAIEIVLVKKNGAAPGSTDKPFLTKPSVVYSSNVQGIGWQAFAADGATSGTEGQGKRLEAIKINLQNTPYIGNITYSTYVQDIGWGNNVSSGDVSGTVGQGKRLEAIKIGLAGDLANYYDVYYRVHSQTFGWLGWAKNGESAGTEGLSTRLEAIEIALVEKGGKAPGSTNKPFITKPSVVYSSQVQDIGWQDFAADGTTSGTEGQAKRLEAIKINLQNAPYSGGITYSSHVQDYGWLNNVSNGAVSGTVGQSKRMEAININLTGDLANYFDIYYRVHIESYGWLGWTKNGMNAGSVGLSKRIEAIEIKLVPKGLGESVNTEMAFKQQILKQPLKVFLDPGHGGSDPGATSGVYHEADLNLAVAKKVQSLLLTRGYTVYMSRNTDTFVSLLNRSQMANDLHADIFVSIHTNSTGTETTSANGIESYYYQYDPGYPSKINAGTDTNPDRIAKSVALANLIRKNLVEYSGANDRGTAGETFSVVRESAMPATLLELGFINNYTERQKLFTDYYQNTLAKAIADGIDEYFKIY
ncbi:N-acetylmuramoyl-L-alanine amidase [Bacillota bacterium Lsc_1132]